MRFTKAWIAVLLLMLFGLSGCPELSQIEGLGGYGSVGGGDVVGEIRDIDTRARQIKLRTDGGRNLDVRYDNRTRVTFQQRDYEISNLEPGDYVAMRAQQDRDGRLYTGLVTVRESVQDRSGTGGGAGRLDRLNGRVEYIDTRRGMFEIRDRQNRLIVVTIPYNSPRSVSDRFDRLREGDNVRLEGRFVNQDRLELEAFL
jgi:hypothetical protein